MPDPRVETLAGRKIIYDRQVEGHYGVTGIPIKPFMQDKFAGQCEACFRQLVDLLEAKNLGPVGSILTGGISRTGSGSSFHHTNRAFDLDGLILPTQNWVADTFPQRPLIYLGIESVLRQHFGTVLSYDYNDDHHDHFHFDNGRVPGFKNLAKSHVIYLQNAIFFAYQIQIGRDGVWGPETRSRSDELRAELGIGAFSQRDNWLEFLDRVANDALDLEVQIIPV